MKIMRVGPLGHERPVAVGPDGTSYDLASITGDIDGQFFASGGMARAQEAIRSGLLPVVDVQGPLRIGAPIARPSAVLCIGLNYAAHAAEAGASLPEDLVLFYKAPNTIVGPNDVVLLPRGSEKTDWEVELGVVIGTRARYLASPADALAHVAGYVVSNDVSERHLQMDVSGGQWSKGKSCETFNPLGPWLVTADEIPDPQALVLQSWVNGEPRQNSTTADMIFGVAQIIYDLSQVTVLEPGDLINTGTPEGVAISGRFPYLKTGDTVELEISSLGRQKQRVA